MVKKIINGLSIAILVVLVIVVLFSFASRIMGKTPSVFGYYIFHVSSDSMEPTLMVGDVILVHSVKAEDIKKNDIITYKSEEGSMYGRDVTHRVVIDPEANGGTYYYQTQGDASGAPLDKKITYAQVEGKYVCKLTLLGKLYGFVRTPLGIIVFMGAILLLFGYEIVSLFISEKKIDESDELLFGSGAKEDKKEK